MESYTTSKGIIGCGTLICKKEKGWGLLGVWGIFLRCGGGGRLSPFIMHHHK